jgi:PmbA protein
VSAVDETIARTANALRALEVDPGDLGVAAWQVHLEDRERLVVGARGRSVGGVYAPPVVRRELSGDVYVQWRDGRVSSASVGSLFLRDPAASLRRLRARAYAERFPADLPDDRELPTVQIHDPALARVAGGDPAAALDLLHDLAPRLTSVTTSYQAEVTVSCAARRLANSKGLARGAEATLASFWVEADGLFSAGISRRDLAALEDARPRVDHLDAWLPSFRAAVPDARSGPRTVVLLPGTAQAFFGHFLLGNLEGEAVANGQSAWRSDDFSAQRQVFGSDLQLDYDPLEDWRPWSYRVDRSGLPAERRAFVREGRLVSPVVSLKAAKQLSCLPSPAPPSSGLRVTAGRGADLDAYVASLDDAVLVHSVLGMHTQDRARGAYSLSVPRALVVRGGRIVGAAKAVISGNFLDDLRGDVVSLTSPLHDGGGLAFPGRVVFPG